MAEFNPEGETQVNDPEGGEGVEPNDPQNAAATAANDPEGAEGKPNDARQGEAGTVSLSKHNADIRRRDKEIAELKEQLKAISDSKASEGSESAQLKRELDDLKRQLADEKVAASLAAAGCIDAKAAKARLEDFDGDVSKLKEAAPYLFKQPQTGRTGGNRTGAPTDHEARLRRAREAAGIKQRKG